MPDGAEQKSPEPALPNGRVVDRDSPGSAPSGMERPHADFPNLDLAALQALAGSGEPSAAPPSWEKWGRASDQAAALR